MSDRSFLPFARPEINGEEINEVVATLQSGWVTTGPRTRAFEERFADYLARGKTGEAEAQPLHCVAVNSATAGLHLALEALGIGPDDEVIVPNYTFTATAEVVRYLGATPVLVDVEEHTFNIDPACVESAITERTRAIMPVHFSGLACDMTTLQALAKRHDLALVEDAAHALPTTWQGRMVGTLGSAACVFSFYANKTMTTGEGGMLVTNDADLAARARTMRLHGISKDVFDRYHSDTPDWYYEVVAPGFKYNMTDIAAALGLHQLKRLPQFHARREDLARRYDEALADLPLRLPAAAPAGDIQARHLYPVRLLPEAGVGRDEFIEAMAARGIGCSVHFIPLHRHPYWQACCGVSEADFPVSEALFQQEVSLPLYTAMSDADLERVVTAVRDVLKRAC
ncbi:dTDP-4-amino-4,6-dideoxygalactose transaminase [Alkalispirillum mobile]|uniref:dTDP-4-amino-4,6-dideoxygalactose transaminase n=1 Tax=Alkalispirillum mobile TaxID=85925 RepID=A0A498C752_9GAMM|nr:DegT/DnrJ/EryC1/StrS family aminotransferase [Alkalispirillum mobile]RLK48368.1 dTDP-4-amino-4,6-dideoxygalactose transaminase [Alkalispirillum mobile]